MILGVQIIGILFGMSMLYLTFLYYKRGDYVTRDFLIWALAWVFFLVMTAYPKLIYSVMDSINIERTADFFVLGGFMFFSIVIFHLYTITKRNEAKLETLVRKIAIERRREKP